MIQTEEGINHGEDLGGTTVKIAYFDEAGTMISKWEIPTVVDHESRQILLLFPGFPGPSWVQGILVYDGNTKCRLKQCDFVHISNQIVHSKFHYRLI